MDTTTGGGMLLRDFEDLMSLDAIASAELGGEGNNERIAKRIQVLRQEVVPRLVTRSKDESSSSSSRSPPPYILLPQVLDHLLVVSTKFSRSYGSIARTHADAWKTTDQRLVREWLLVIFDATFLILSSLFEADALRELHRTNKMVWVSVQSLDIMSQLEFCRRPGHEGYVHVLRCTLPVVGESPAAAALVLHQLLAGFSGLERERTTEDTEGAARSWLLRDAVNQSRAYFLLRLIPSVAPPDPGSRWPWLDALLGLLLACCKADARPGQALHPPPQASAPMDQLRDLAHEVWAMLFSPQWMPYPATSTASASASASRNVVVEVWFPLYVARSLEGFPAWTPFDALGRTVLAVAKRPDLPAAVLENLVHQLAPRSQASAQLRQLCFGLSNVVPLHLLGLALDLFLDEVYTKQASASARGRSFLEEEMCRVMDVNGDYQRKPQIARWFQHNIVHGGKDSYSKL